MWKDIIRKFKIALQGPSSLTRICLILSAYTLFIFNIPFFKEVFRAISSNLNGAWIVISMFIIMLALNFFIYYILLYLGRVVGKSIIALTMIGNAACLYFMVNFNVLIDRTMMGNVFVTNFSEASSFFSWTIIAYILLLGIPPCVWLFYKKINYGSIKRSLANVGIALAIILGTVIGNKHNVLWIDYNATVLGSKIMPWSYIINSFRYFNHLKSQNVKEIRLPDAEFINDSKDICVLIIGESARSKNFSLYGYKRKTNPLLETDSVTVLKAKASDTYTTEAVKALLSYKPSEELYEILPNYLERNGVDVIWRTNNWGNPPLHIKKHYNANKLKERFPQFDEKGYDGLLFHNLKEEILACDSTKNKIFIGIHTYTSHGPQYHASVPNKYKVFTPECKTVDLQTAKQSELINAYDNTIVYTDHLVHSVIEMLKTEFPDRRSCVIFISDHGESLGEDGNYMHGIPKSMAPSEQIDIPFIVWTSDDAIKVKDMTAGHYNTYHSVLKFLGMNSPIYDESKNIFR